MPYFSVIVPIYNRRDEVDDLLESLVDQTNKDFEVILVDDGSTERCDLVATLYAEKLDLHYFWKENEGRSIARNYGIEKARGEYFVFFDSDTIIPMNYFETLYNALADNYVTCFGGPDAASADFSDTQKAINFSMTSFLTTGGIRGGKVQLEKFVPRSFNMGFSREVYETVGGFREMFSEDIDMSTRIRQAGFDIRLIREAFVYHKRRTSLRKFARQTYIFGMSRVTLKLLYPDTMKAVHWLPALFLIGCVALIVLAFVFKSWWWVSPILLYAAIIYCVSLWQNRSMNVAWKSVKAAFVQLCSYGFGFLKAYFVKIILGKGRDEEEEIRLRKGK